MKNKNLFIQYNIYFVGGGLLVLIIAIVFFVVSPMFNKLNKDSDAVQKRILDISIEKEKISKLPELKRKFEIIEPRQNELNLLFSNDKIVNLIQELEYMADKTNNDISINVDESGEKKKLISKKDVTKESDSLTSFKKEDYFEMEINLIGNYENLLSFIYKLNNMPYYNSLLSFNIVIGEIDIKNNEQVVIPKNTNFNLFNGNNINNEQQDALENKQKILQSKLKVIFYLKK